MTWADFCKLSEHDKALVRERARLIEDIAANDVNYNRDAERLVEIDDQLER